MKFILTFKTPDVLDPVFDELVDTSCKDHDEHDMDCPACLNEEENACVLISEVKKIEEKFILYGEQITVEFDTKAGTATVISSKK